MYKEKFNLTGKVAIITGGAGLVGSAVAEGLAEYGCNVVISDIAQEKCTNLADMLRDRYGIGCLGKEVDVSNKKSVELLLNETLDKFKKVDILITAHQNKPARFFKRFEEYSEEDFNDVISVNLKGVFLCCQVIGNQMIRQGQGNIINFASTYGVVSPNQEIYLGTAMGSPAAYSASKGGVILLTKYLATYWAEKKIRVNAISPHGVFNNHEERFIKQFSDKSPLKRMSTKDEVVGGIIYLASDASTYVTGHNLMVDGGWTAW
jgi:NAD(P)-dependent dehydrogenase (short-subunit alcohol dehydrogenase family)